MTAGTTKIVFPSLLLIGLLLSAGGSAQAQIEPGFTYQGELRLLGTPTEGEFDFRFRLYDDPGGGPPVGPQLTLSAVTVEDGVFTVHLDFGADALSSAPRWLEIDVRASGATGFETLTPRTLLATVPYAWNAARVLPGSVAAESIQPGAVGADQIDAEAVQRRVADSCPSGQFIRAVNADGSAVCASGGSGGGAAWLLGGNAGTDPAVNYLGTSDNRPLILGANGQALVRVAAVQPGTSNATANIIMGHPDNTIRPGVRGAVIGGGGLPSGNPNPLLQPNQVTDHFGTIGGGHANVAGNDDDNPSSATGATVGGGVDNQARARGATVAGGEINFVTANFGSVGGGQKNFATETGATVAGGEDNRAEGITSAVAGGKRNSATGMDSVVSGGGFNTASGRGSVVPGGELNCAGGTYSWAGGRRAKVRPGSLSGDEGDGCDRISQAGDSGDQGTFIWADSQPVNFQSTGSNQFLVRAQGGIFLGTGGPVNLPSGRFINTSSGAHLTSGGVWTNNSSRAFKTDFKPVDPLQVLERLLQLPLSTWTYLSAPDNGRHLGPIAEEFHASFGLGADSASITTVDASGVALAAIQGLNQRLEAENAALREQNAEQDAAIAELRAELDELRSLLRPAITQQP